MPALFIFTQNYPNLFDPKINFINHAINVPNGNHVRKIINQKLSPGQYVMNWYGTDDLLRTTPAGIKFLLVNNRH